MNTKRFKMETKNFNYGQSLIFLLLSICTPRASFHSLEPRRDSVADGIFSSSANTQTKLRRASIDDYKSYTAPDGFSLIASQCSVATGSCGSYRTRKFLGGSLVQKNSRESMQTPVRVSVGSGNGGLGKSLVTGVGERNDGIIFDHGSRRKESNLMLNEFAAMFKDRTRYAIVEPAHMELAKPSIQDAFTSCVQRGANRVIVSPFFL